MIYKYLADGHQVSVEKVLDGGYVASRLYEAYAGDGIGDIEVEGDALYYESSQLFDKPPVEKLSAEIKKLRDEISILKEASAKEKAEAKKSIAEIDKLKNQRCRDYEQRVADSKRILSELPLRHEQLKNIDLLFNGGIEYVVTCNTGNQYRHPSIVKASEEISGIKSLVLVSAGNTGSHKDPDAARWEIRGFRDDYGYSVTLHASYDDAKKKYAEVMNEWVNSNPEHVSESYLASLKAHNIEPSERALNIVKRKHERKAHREREEAEAAIKAATEKLATLEQPQ